MLHRFSFPPSGHLLRVIHSVIVALTLSAVLTAVYCTVRAGSCCGQGRVVTCYLLGDSLQLRLAFMCLMFPAADMHFHGSLTDNLNIAHWTRQNFGILVLLPLPLFVVLLPPVLRTGPTLLLCETLAQLFFSALPFTLFYFFGLSTKVLPVSGPDLTFSWGLESSASSGGLHLFAAIVRADCIPIDGAGADDWVHIRRELLVDIRKRRRVTSIPI